MRRIHTLPRICLNLSKNKLSTRYFSDTNLGPILRQNESYKEYEKGPIWKLYANQIGIHNPIQDTWGEAMSIHNNDLMFGVFDGNSGMACSHVVAKRIFRYLTVSLLPREILAEYVKSSNNRFRHVEILKSVQDKLFFLEEYKETYEDSLNAYAEELYKSGRELETHEALSKSFERLDEDMSREALQDQSENGRFVSVAMSGTGATVLHLSGRNVTVATAGDALVVVGSRDRPARVISTEHNVENRKEVERVMSEHPDEQGVVENGLLLGSLTSFRSFGNFRYKWDKDTSEKILVPRYGPTVIPAKCQSPPYLTARPDISRYSLRAEDDFIVLASDGIWDVFPPDKVVEIVSNHKPIHWLKKKMLTPWAKVQSLKGIVMKEKPKEEAEVENSPATQLILEAMDATTKKLHLPKRYIRNIRDDMTAVVLYINKKFINPVTEVAVTKDLNSTKEIKELVKYVFSKRRKLLS